jgi:hypothetical protein
VRFALMSSSNSSREMQALHSKAKMRYVTPLVFNYSFAVNNYRSMLRNASEKYRQMQFVVA